MAKRGRKEKDNWKKKRRQEYLEKKEFRYYIFCEGQATEPKYFQGFKRYIEDNPIYRDMVLIEIEGCQAETMRVIGKAEEYVRENKITKGQIWCVYDKDSFPSSDVNGVVQRAEVLNQKNPDIISNIMIRNRIQIIEKCQIPNNTEMQLISISK